MIDFKEGVTLGALPPSHEKLRSWRNDRRVWQWCRQYDLISEEEQKAWYEAQAKDPSIKMYGVFDRDQALVGVAGFTGIDRHNRRAEFSLYIGPEFWGHHYGRASLLTLFAHGFRNLGFNLIWGETYEGNPAARIFEEIGMIREGTRREFYFRDGRFIDCHLYSMLARDWFHRFPDGKALGKKGQSRDPVVSLAVHGPDGDSRALQIPTGEKEAQAQGA